MLLVSEELDEILSLSDRILVMADGQIVEEGTHDALLQKGGLYAGFWERQSGGFLTTEEDAA